MVVDHRLVCKQVCLFLCRILPPPKEIDPIGEHQVFPASADPRTSSDGMYATVQDALVTTKSPIFSPPGIPPKPIEPTTVPMPEYASVQNTPKSNGDDSAMAQLTTDTFQVPCLESVATDYEKPINKSKIVSNPTGTTPETHNM